MKIGIMDSGAGGLTILNRIHTKLPSLDLVYLADETFAPYGNKDPEALQHRLVAIGAFFHQEGVSAIVVACNTATVVGIEALRASTVLPVIGVEPAVKPACRMGNQRRVAVLATPVTAQSARLTQLIELWKADSYVSIISSSSLAYDIDAWPESVGRIKQTIASLAKNMQTKQIDTLVLACTHYPLVKALFEEELGAACEIVEPSEGVSSQLIRRLTAAYPEQMMSHLDSNCTAKGQIQLCSSISLDNMPRLLNWVTDKAAVLAQRHVHI
ncbi:glutamate racemase [Marinomonas sp. A79]|uniref:Glutamate racemase n=1 Tax=Marinomonas vulgaris TaxID=2823372 RepID=A0ABS5HA08_9GAMM|nr:glutamate racemase [Marinomonas vulgaris]MBR7888507.1 glutamate racemase [Marinomonas vulgaris]